MACSKLFIPLIINLFISLNASSIESGMICLTFDDGTLDHYTTLAPLLDKHQVSGTFYITASYIGHEGFLNEIQLKELKDKGHEIASHGLTHRHYNKLSSRDAELELGESKKNLEEIIQAEVTDFATPYGSFSGALIEPLKKWYLSNRTIKPGLNGEKFDPYAIRGQVMYKSTPLSKIEEWLSEASKEKKWLVLVYHLIDESGKDLSVPPSVFETHLTFMLKSGLPICTVSAAMQKTFDTSP